ncbi:MAG TPA: Stp1/IreP family PP2C-type Ser/Thr phosphatase [Labilithrix sp.]
MTQAETPVPKAPTSEPEAGADDVRVKLFARTDVGQVREHNEDNFLVADLTRRSRGLLEANRATTIGHQGAVFAVCDGMGGAAAGEIASQLAVDIIYERLVDGLNDRPLKRDELARRLVRAVEAAGLRIFHEAKADRSRRGMGTTVTAAALVDDVLFFAQVGDSRGYVLRGDTLVQLTRDQSLVNQLIEAGQLTEEEAETFEHNNIILQALGTSDTVQVDLTFAEIRRGDVLLLCSDGLSGMVRFDEIREILKANSEPLEVCKALTERANAAGGHDNITVIIVQFDGPGIKAAAEGEQLKYRKYVLSDEALSDTAPVVHANAAAVPGSPGPPNATNDSGAAAARPVSAPPPGWQEPGSHVGEYDPNAIEIPGTHVPVWMVVGIVVGVIILLAGTAFLLLR